MSKNKEIVIHRLDRDCSVACSSVTAVLKCAVFAATVFGLLEVYVRLATLPICSASLPTAPVLLILWSLTAMCLFALKHPFTPQCVLDLIRLDEMKPWKTVVVQLAAELLGTFLLVVVGCGSTTTAWSEGYQPTTVQVALTFGLTVACIVQTLGYVSGAHVNPAVTVGLVVGGFLGPLKALLYVTAQCVGATAGSFVLQALTPNETVATLGVNALNRHVTPTQGCFVEMVISFVLVMAVYSAATGGAAAAAAAAGPFTVGMSITACHLFAMQYTGAGMNPARSFGPAFVTESWTNHWVYWVGPCVGGVAAGIVYQYFRREEPVDASESRASPGQASGMASGVAERNV